MFKKILVVVSDHPASMQAIRQGVEVARCNDGEIIFFHLLPNFGMVPMGMDTVLVPPSLEYEKAARAEASALLRKASSIAEEAGVMSFRSMRCVGASGDAQCITLVAEKRGCQLIVVGTDSRNAVIRLIGGDIVPGLISHAKVPILVCHAKDSRPKSTRRTRVSAEKSRSFGLRQQGEMHIHVGNE